MNLDEANKLLELPAGATPEQIETRFHELRARLEDKLAKAPTPGLKDKYRRALEDLAQAFETLVLAADASSLPVLQRSEAPKATPQQPAAPGGAKAVRPAAASKRGGQKELMIVTVIAVLVLGAGAWWVVKTRAANDEKARQEAQAKVEAEAERVAAGEKAKAEVEAKRLAEEKARQEAQAQAKAEADRKAAEEKTKAAEEAKRMAEEKTRQDALFASLRAKQAEVKVRWETLERELAAAERRLAELKGDTRSTRDLAAPVVAELQAKFTAQGDYVEWLQSYLTRHGARTQLARLDAFLSAKALEDAAGLEGDLAKALGAAEKEIGAQKAGLLALGRPMQITSEPAGLRYRLTDAYGRTREGTTPATVEAPWGRAEIVITGPGPGWADARRELRIGRETVPEVKAEFGLAAAQVASVPAGLSYELTNALGLSLRGTTPAELKDVPTGPVTLRVQRPGWADVVNDFTVAAGQPSRLAAEFASGSLSIASEPSGAAVWAGDKQLGVTPMTLEGLATGERTFSLRLKMHAEKVVKGTVLAKQQTKLRAVLTRQPSPGEVWKVPDLEMELVWLPAGYWAGKYEVTQAEYEKMMGVNYSRFRGARRPVEMVSGNDAVEFCKKLTERERQAGRLPDGYAYTLPTERQWEHYVGDARLEDAVTGQSRSRSATENVGSLGANRFGLYDVRGNVREWCADWYGSSQTARVFRGASWHSDNPDDLAVSYRYSTTPGIRDIDVGFRVVLVGGSAR